MKKFNLSENLLIGSLLFGLFFGAGNLIFPLELGFNSGGNLLYVTIGFLLSAVTLPILAVVATAASDSESLFDICRPTGVKFAYFFTCLLYLAIGPGFAIPRTATTSYEMVIGHFEQLNNSFSLIIFSIVFFAMVLYFSIKKAKLINTIGRYMTPIFLCLLSILLILSIIKPIGAVGSGLISKKYIASPLTAGIIDGYNTLDAPAGLAFAIIIISNIKNLGIKEPKSIAIETLKSGIVCLLAMSVIYAGLAYMGSCASNIMDEAENGARILAEISNYYLGGLGHLLLSAIVYIACLKTAIGLVSACSEMFVDMFKFNISYKKYCLIFTILSFLVANLGLKQIIALSLPVLLFIYPISIVLIFLSIISIYIGKRKIVYQAMLLTTGLAAVIDFLKASPAFISSSNIITSIVDFTVTYLPGASIGFGWVIPAILGLIIGLILDKKYIKN